MLSDVVVVGVLKENIGHGFRNIFLDYFDALQRKNIPSLIPLLYWTREENSRLNKIKEGTVVAIKGHLESDEDIGIFVVCESIHFTK